MNKIRLDLDRLAVESFPTDADPSDTPGTVHAYHSHGLNCGNTVEWCPNTGSPVATGCTCDCTGFWHPSCDITCQPSQGDPACQSGDINC